MAKTIKDVSTDWPVIMMIVGDLIPGGNFGLAQALLTGIQLLSSGAKFLPFAL
jgi:hypothetical protein